MDWLFKDRRVLVTCILLVTGILASIICTLIGSMKITLASIASVTICLVILLKLIRDDFRKLSLISESIAKGTIPDIAPILQKNATVMNLKSMHFKYLELVAFIQSMGTQDKFQFNYIDSNSKIGQLLIGLQERQKLYLEEEQRRSWTNEGIAQFSDMLRIDKQDVEEVSIKILTQLIKYVGVNQGGFFIANENDGKRTLELTACFAYNRAKYLKKIIEEGDGLLGQAMLEKNLIYRKEIPEGYTTITSGLGEATPTNLLIVPLMVDDNLCGAIELASFEVLEQYKIDFIKKIAENIASTIATVKASENAQVLLNQSHLMAEELKAQEEELKQNMVQLQSAQEQMEKHQIELQSLFGAIESHSGLAEFDDKGNLIKVNDWLLNKFGFDTGNLRPCAELLINEEEKDELCHLLKQGQSVEKEIQVLSKYHEQIWLNIYYSPIFDKNKKFKGVLMLCQDITLKKNQQLEIKSHLETLNKTLVSLEFSIGGKINSVNEVFLNITGYKVSEILGKKYTDLLPNDEVDKPQNQMMWQSLKAGNYFNGQFRYRDKNGKSIWLSGTLNPITNDEGKVIKIMMFAQLITQEKVRLEDMSRTINAFKSSTLSLELAPDYTIKSVSRKFQEVFEYSRTELRNKPITRLIRNTDNLPGFILNDHKEPADTRKLILIAKSGKEIECSIAFYKIENSDNEVIKILGVLETDLQSI